MTSKQLIFGLHAVTALLQKQPDRVQRLCIQQDRGDKKIEMVLRLANEHDVSIEKLPRKELDRLTEDGNHQGVLAYCEQSQRVGETDLKTLIQNIDGPPLVLVLDGLQDPHNLGACFRSADAAGVHVIIAPKDKSVGITPVVTKVACGAVETIPFVQVTNLARTLELLKELGLWLYGAAAEGPQTLYQTDLTGPAAIVMGAEGEGLRRLTRETCDVLVNVPMHGSVSSLNVSVATGVFLFEAVRQRLAKRK